MKLGSAPQDDGLTQAMQADFLVVKSTPELSIHQDMNNLRGLSVAACLEARLRWRV